MLGFGTFPIKTTTTKNSTTTTKKPVCAMQKQQKKLDVRVRDFPYIVPIGYRLPSRPVPNFREPWKPWVAASSCAYLYSRQMKKPVFSCFFSCFFMYLFFHVFSCTSSCAYLYSRQRCLRCVPSLSIKALGQGQGQGKGKGKEG